ncbi:MAG: IclR family transcriptional regulator C-terminal domain-containing protein [Pseudomonadota bacterium]
MTSLNLGSILPLLTSATGRAFCAFLPTSMTEHLVRREIAAARRGGTQLRKVLSKIDIQEICSAVRKDGCATVDSSFIPGLSALAAPVLDVQGEACLVITLIGNDPVLLDPKSETRRALFERCRELSLKQVNLE